MKNKKIITYSLDIKGWHRLANEVLDGGGISTCIPAQSNNLTKKVIVVVESDKNKSKQ